MAVRDRRRAGGDCLRRVEPAHRGHGRSQHPAHSGGAPDGRHGAGRPARQKTGNEIGYPIVRDMDVFMYERQRPRGDGGGLLRAPPHPGAARTTFRRSPMRSARPPRCRSPATTSRPQLGHAREIMGGLLAGTGMQYSVNGLLSLTPDTHQVLGETAEVEEAVVGGSGVDQGGARHRAPDRGVDDLRLPASVRPARLRHHPILCPRAHRAATSARAPTSTSTRPTESYTRVSNGPPSAA